MCLSLYIVLFGIYFIIPLNNFNYLNIIYIASSLKVLPHKLMCLQVLQPLYEDPSPDESVIDGLHNY